MSICLRTGRSHCGCANKPYVTEEGAMALLDVKSALRALMTDHAVYTAEVIAAHVPVANQGAIDAFTARVLQNPKDIGNLLTPIVGDELSYAVEDAFTEHLKLAATATASLDAQDIQNFIEQSVIVAEALTELNAIALPLDVTRNMMNQHVLFVVELVQLRSGERYADYVKKYDQYYAHILGLADALYNALVNY